MKLCHMTGYKVGIPLRNHFFGGEAAPQKFGSAKKSKIRPDIGQLSILTANILGTDRDIKHRKKIDRQPSLLGLTKNWWFLVHKKVTSADVDPHKFKIRAISGNFKLWPQIFLKRINKPKIDNKLYRPPSLPRWTKKLGELWSTNKKSCRH